MSKKNSFTLHLDLETLFTEFEFLKTYVNKDINVTFLDEHKISHKARISSANDSRYCFWDRNPFNWKGIECPIQKIYKPKVEEYVSSINGSRYFMNDSINVISNVVEVDGYFCSSECCLAYIRDNEHDPRFRNSEHLLLSIVKEKIKPAPSWRLLSQYGGNLSINEFRNNSRCIEMESIITAPTYYIFKETYYL